MGHELAEWIWRARAQFPSQRPWPVQESLPELILERLAALGAAERRRSSEVGNEERPKRQRDSRNGSLR